MHKNIAKDIERIREEDTGTPDCAYALISVCHTLLKGVETLSLFIEDAEEEGDKEVARFLSDTRAEFVRRAGQAKKLLAQAL